MTLKHYASKLKKSISIIFFKFSGSRKERFECPVCNYRGRFMNLTTPTGSRKYARCPDCKALERHRLQFLVMNHILEHMNTTSMKIIHFAPETFLRNFFSKRFGKYESADLSKDDVDHHVDLRQLPFHNESYDFVFASHVMEHIIEDKKAISEIRRILKPKGIAILPVPILADKTVEYPGPNPIEAYHVRAPGLDYFERYKPYFSRIEKFSSDSFPEKYQLYIYEDRTQCPTKECPLRPFMPGNKHIEIVPVCYV